MVRQHSSVQQDPDCLQQDGHLCCFHLERLSSEKYPKRKARCGGIINLGTTLDRRKLTQSIPNAILNFSRQVNPSASFPGFTIPIRESFLT